MSGTTSDRLARRYGRRPGAATSGTGATGPSGRAVWWSAAVVALAIAAVIGWITASQQEPVASVTAATYRVVSDNEVTLTFAVVRPDPTVPVTCTVEATDASHAQVGATVLEIPAGTASSTQVTATVVTYARAEQAQAMDNGCFAVDAAS